MSLLEYFAFLLQGLTLNPPTPTIQQYLPELCSIQLPVFKHFFLFLLLRYDPLLATSHNQKSSSTPSL